MWSGDDMLSLVFLIQDYSPRRNIALKLKKRPFLLASCALMSGKTLATGPGLQGDVKHGCSGNIWNQRLDELCGVDRDSKALPLAVASNDQPE